MLSNIFKSIINARIRGKGSNPTTITTSGTGHSSTTSFHASTDFEPDEEVILALQDKAYQEALQSFDTVFAGGAPPGNKKNRSKAKQAPGPMGWPFRGLDGRFMSKSSIIMQLNIIIPEFINNVMVRPSLVNRTSRFRHSVKFRALIWQRGNPTAILGYSYMEYPYGIFDPMRSNSPLASQARNPRNIIRKAMNNALLTILAPASFTTSAKAVAGGRINIVARNVGAV